MKHNNPASSPLRVLIVEEALRDREGHWFEYNRATKAALQSLGDIKVDMLGNITMDSTVADELRAVPHFRYTVWDQIYNHPQAWRRYLGIARHNMRLYQDLSRHLKSSPCYDIVFAPTVVLHHLVAYRRIAKRFSGKQFGQLVLLVRNSIALYDANGARTFRATARFWRSAICRFLPLIRSGQVRFVTDSERLADEYEALTGLRFEVLPHPSLIGLQTRNDCVASEAQTDAGKVRIFLPGPARYEKGADRLVEAAKLLAGNPSLPPTEFVFQWSGAFELPNGTMCYGESLQSLKLGNASFEVISKPLDSQSYYRQLINADLIVLPYRRDAYFARISGVAVEAMMLGKPMLYTSNTWVHTIASQFGLGTPMEDSAEGVAAAIAGSIAQLPALKDASRLAQPPVANFFSAANFSRALLGRDRL